MPGEQSTQASKRLPVLGLGSPAPAQRLARMVARRADLLESGSISHQHAHPIAGKLPFASCLLFASHPAIIS